MTNTNIWIVFTAVSPSVNCFIYLVLVVSPCCSDVFGKASEATIKKEQRNPLNDYNNLNTDHSHQMATFHHTTV